MGDAKKYDVLWNCSCENGECINFVIISAREKASVNLIILANAQEVKSFFL